MSLISLSGFTIPQQQLLSEELDRIREKSSNIFLQIISLETQWVNLFFTGRVFDAQTLADNLSGDAVKFLNYTRDLRTYILSVANDSGVPVTLTYPPSAYIISGDTVTFLPSSYNGP